MPPPPFSGAPNRKNLLGTREMSQLNPRLFCVPLFLTTAFGYGYAPLWWERGKEGHAY